MSFTHGWTSSKHTPSSWNTGGAGQVQKVPPLMTSNQRATCVSGSKSGRKAWLQRIESEKQAATTEEEKKGKAGGSRGHRSPPSVQKTAHSSGTWPKEEGSGLLLEKLTREQVDGEERRRGDCFWLWRGQWRPHAASYQQLSPTFVCLTLGRLVWNRGGVKWGIKEETGRKGETQPWWVWFHCLLGCCYLIPPQCAAN